MIKFMSCYKIAKNKQISPTLTGPIVINNNNNNNNDTISQYIVVRFFFLNLIFKMNDEIKLNQSQLNIFKLQNQKIIIILII